MPSDTGFLAWLFDNLKIFGVLCHRLEGWKAILFFSFCIHWQPEMDSHICQLRCFGLLSRHLGSLELEDH